VRSDKSQPNNESQERSKGVDNTNESQEKSEGVDNTKQENLMRRGRNQLILKPPSTMQRLTAANTTNTVTTLPTSMKRQGRNKLVTSLTTTVQKTSEKDAPAKQQDVENEKNTKRRSTEQQGIPDTAHLAVVPTSNLERVAPNKLSFPQSKKHAIKIPPGLRKKRPPPWAAKRSGAKRIAINTSMTDNNDGHGQLLENHDHDDDKVKLFDGCRSSQRIENGRWHKAARQVQVLLLLANRCHRLVSIWALFEYNQIHERLLFVPYF
jgi:hypothetical protein